MPIMPDPQQQMLALFAGIGVVLVVASAIGFVLKTSVARGQPHGGIDNLNARIKAWWVMVLVSGVRIPARPRRRDAPVRCSSPSSRCANSCR